MARPKTNIFRRAFASALDYFLIFSVFVGLFRLIVLFDSEGARATAGCSLYVVMPVVWSLYFGLTEATFGRTLGKALFDLSVERIDGRPLSFSDALRRHILDPIDFGSWGLVAIIAVKLSPLHQRLGDMFARTRVVLLTDVPANAQGS